MKRRLVVASWFDGDIFSFFVWHNFFSRFGEENSMENIAIHTTFHFHLVILY